MVYTTRYVSPLGCMLLAASDKGLVGAWFCGARYFAEGLPSECAEGRTPILKEAEKWLDIYFGRSAPEFTPPLEMQGSEFCREVWDILMRIPYGKTVTYGDIARMLAEKKGLAKMSAQAVGGAVGHNRISLIIPCHRVVGADGSLTGYSGGIEKKAALLALERDTALLKS